MRLDSNHLDPAHPHHRLREYVVAGAVLFVLFALLAWMSSSTDVQDRGVGTEPITVETP